MRTNSTAVQAEVAVKTSDTSCALCSGIQFDEDDCSPEEQQLELTKRMIWEKLMARMGTRAGAV